MTYSFGSFARLINALSQSKPLRSIFAHKAGVSRMARCTCCSSGGFGGLPRGRFSCSMRRSVAQIYRDTNNPCNPDLLGYTKCVNHKGTGEDQMAKANNFLRRTQAKLDAMKACGCICAEIRNGEFWAVIAPHLSGNHKQYRITAWTPFAKQIGIGVTSYSMGVGFGLPAILNSAKRAISEHARG